MSAMRVPARGRRHPMTVVKQARELVAGGWKPSEVARLFANDGVFVDERSVRRWTNPRIERGYEQRSRERRRRNARRSGAAPMGRWNATPDFKHARMQILRNEIGLNQAQIARLLSHDFGDQISANQVRHALKTGRYPRSLA